MRNHAALRNWLIAFALGAIAVIVCVRYVDSAVAEFFETHLGHTESWVWLNCALRPLDVVVVTMLFFPLAYGLCVGSGRQLRQGTEVPLLCSWSAILGGRSGSRFEACLRS